MATKTRPKSVLNTPDTLLTAPNLKRITINTPKTGISYLFELFKYIRLTCNGLVDEGDHKKSIMVTSVKVSLRSTSISPNRPNIFRLNIIYYNYKVQPQPRSRGYAKASISEEGGEQVHIVGVISLLADPKICIFCTCYWETLVHVAPKTFLWTSHRLQCFLPTHTIHLI